MKIQINITNHSKEVIIEESCDFRDLVDFMKRTFPNDWESFKLIPKVIFNDVPWTYVNPNNPWWCHPWYTSTGDTYTYGNPSSYVLKNGTFQVKTTNEYNTRVTGVRAASEEK